MELDNFDSAAVKLKPSLSMKILSIDNFYYRNSKYLLNGFLYKDH